MWFLQFNFDKNAADKLSFSLENSPTAFRDDRTWGLHEGDLSCLWQQCPARTTVLCNLQEFSEASCKGDKMEAIELNP